MVDGGGGVGRVEGGIGGAGFTCLLKDNMKIKANSKNKRMATSIQICSVLHVTMRK
jgi:hypothetical protein